MKKFCTLAILMFFFCFVNAQTFTWTGFAPVLDNTTDTIPITVSGLPNVIDSSFGVAHICMDITHTYKSDLVVKMISPAGTTVVLIQAIGGSDNNFIGTCVGMDGTPWSNSQAPYTGLYVPVGNIAGFNNGQNPNGIWKLLVSDVAGQDTGSVHRATIAFVNNPPVPAGTPVVNPGPTGIAICATCQTPGNVPEADLLPDMTSSAKEILVNHNETPGALYISNATPNIGYGPIEIYGIDSCFCGTSYVPCGTACPNGDPIKHAVKQRIYHKILGHDTLSYYDRFAGFMTYHPAHQHIHVDNWAYYTLRTQTSNPDARTWPIVGTGVKQSFCLINLGTCANNNGECLDNFGNVITTVPNQDVGFHTGCGFNQGIYPGNFDVYSISLNDPIPLNNVCNGNYYIVSITDPSNNFLESDESNNWVAVPITLTQQNAAPVISANGPTSFCMGGSVTLTSNSASNYLWSTGEVTQSIVVTTPGTYTVSTNCGSSTATSNPVTITVTQLAVSGSANPSSVNCNGATVQLNSSSTSGGTQNIPVTFTNSQQIAIPENNTTGVMSPITVSGINPATLSSGMIVNVKINITHTYDGDLAISLISPSGNTIFLSNRRGSGGDNYVNCVFAMSASTSVVNGTAPFTGSFIPEGSFNTFTGNVNGIWKLKVQDLADVDVGTINNWSITINNAVTEVLNYAWSSTPPGFSSTVQNPVVNPTTSTSYLVTVTSSATGCIGTKSISVTVPPVVTINNFSPTSGAAGSLVNIFGTGFANATSVTIAGLSASFTIINENQIQATVPNVSNGSGVVCVNNFGNCGACSITNYTIGASAPVTLGLRVYIEGYYADAGLMDNYGQGGYLYLMQVNGASYNDVDSIEVSAMESNPPYSEVDRQTTILHIDGSANVSFGPAVSSGIPYYISVRHRNSIETWSSSPVTFSALTNYDFTTSSTKALDDGFKLPMKKVDNNPDTWAIFGGDVNGDGAVNSLDMTMEEIASNVNLYGYWPTDLDGDGGSTSLDMTIIETNSNGGVYSMHP